MVNNKNVLEKEFLYRYLILKAKADGISLDKFFFYANLNPDLIEANTSNPLILDLYHDYYLYLLKNDEKDKADKILEKLYEKQKNLNVFIYSPFVETELAKIQKDLNNSQKSLDYLLEAINNTRKIRPNDEVKIYYEVSKLYDVLNNKEKKDEYI